MSVILPDDPVYLSADRTRLSQILGNLLHNACKYTQSGGHINLSVETDGRDVVFRLQDDGIGISRENLDCIFDLFMQIDNSPDRSTGGTGLGLTFVRRLATLHGGTVEVYSQGLGMGSEFVVRLPIRIDAPRKTEPDIPLAIPAKRLLLVDDNADAADTLAAILRHLGFEVKSAYDGLSAIKLISQFSPEIILLDLGMPMMDGFTTCEHIRREPGGRDCLIIALTGWSQSDVADKVSRSGFDGHLVKPVRHPELIQNISALLNTRKNRPVPAQKQKAPTHQPC